MKMPLNPPYLGTTRSMARTNVGYLLQQTEMHPRRPPTQAPPLLRLLRLLYLRYRTAFPL